ncbi:MAG TPA: PaaI family thioesterase [Bryobacteraceae bacterium]
MPEHFGIRVTDADNDKLVGELDVDDRHLNNSGHVHGGALAAFADDLGGRLAGLNVPPGFRTTTIESKTNIFRACVPGRLTGMAVPVHCGAANDRPANLNLPPGRKAGRDDDPDADGAPKGVGDISR